MGDWLMARFHNVDGERIPFTAEEEAAQDAIVAAHEADRPRRLAMQEIVRLEASISERRKREAILGNAEAIAEIQGVEDLIAIERAKL